MRWLRVLLSSAWIGWILVGTGPMWTEWRVFWQGLLADPPMPTSVFAILRAAGSHAMSLGLVVLISLIWMLAGARASGFLRIGRGDVSVTVAIRMLLGLGITALSFYGVAMAGLYFPVVLVLGTLLLGVAGWRSRRLRRSSREPVVGRIHWIWIPIALMPVLHSPLLLVPPVAMDAWHYHLAVPQHFLGLHKFHTEGTNMGFHLELACEIQNVFAVLSRHEALATWIALAPYLAAVVAAGRWAARMGGAWGGGVCVGLLLALGPVIGTAAAGKNDVACAAACLMALLAQADRRVATAAVCWGVAAAIKVNGLVFALMAAAWWIVSRGSRSSFQVWIPAFLLPAPLLLRTWLVRGDPHWPALGALLPGAMTEEATRAAFGALMNRHIDVSGAFAEFSAAVYAALPTLPLVVPMVVGRWKQLDPRVGRVAWLSLAQALGFIVFVWYEFDRMILPALAGWCVVSGVALGGFLSSRTFAVRVISLVLICTSAWAPLSNYLQDTRNRMSIGYLAGGVTRTGWFAAHWTTAWDTRRELSREPGVRGVLLVNGHALYLWPGKIRSEEFGDRSATWALTRSSRTPQRVAIRLRQSDVTHLVFNSVEPFHLAAHGRMYRFFAWDNRQLDVLYGLMSAHLAPVIHPVRSDRPNGAFYVWRLLRHARQTGLAIPDLPGAKEVLWRTLHPYLERGDAAEALRRVEWLVSRYPEVAAYRHLRGSLLIRLERWREAYGDLDSVLRGGYVGDYSSGLAAQAAVNMRKPELAIPLARRVLELHPDRRDETIAILASALALDAVRLADRGTRTLRQAVSQAREAVSLAPPGSPLVRLCLGAVLRRAGADSESRRVLEAVAAEVPPEGPIGRECRKELHQLAASP